MVKLMTNFAILAMLLVMPPTFKANANDIEDVLELKPVYHLDEQDGRPEVMNGFKLKPSDWPSTFYLGQHNCTANLVGPKVLILAAHCLQNHKNIKIVTVDGPVLKGTCTSDNYDPRSLNQSSDRALCLLESRIENVMYESIQTAGLAQGAKVLIVGFGCDEIQKSGGCTCIKFNQAGECEQRELPEPGKDTCILRGGRTTVSIPQGLLTNAPDMFETEGEATACLGDSGGGVFQLAGQRNARKLSGITQSSLLAKQVTRAVATFSPGSVKFLSDWSAKTGSEICGLNFQSVLCR